MSAAERRQLRRRLIVLYVHLLKWKHQQDRRTPSWAYTIADQRRRLSRLLASRPSLAITLELHEDAFMAARLAAQNETGLPINLFPADPPFSPEQAFSDDLD